jgi:hypothetical protein
LTQFHRPTFEAAQRGEDLLGGTHLCLCGDGRSVSADEGPTGANDTSSHVRDWYGCHLGTADQ